MLGASRRQYGSTPTKTGDEPGSTMFRTQGGRGLPS